MNLLAQILKKDKKFLILLFLISFCIRLIFFLVLLNRDNSSFLGDAEDYNIVAKQISSGNGITQPDGQPSFWRVPGYSLFLAFFYKFFTTTVTKVMITQIFLMAFIPLLVFLLSLTLFPHKFLLAKIASIFFALNIGFIFYSGVMMSDLLFVLFFLLFLILFFWNSNALAYKRLFFAGLFLGIASLIRPMGHFLLLASVVVLFIQNFSQNYLIKIKKSCILSLGWIAIISWWLLRNYVLSGGFVFFHTMPMFHFLNYVAIPIEMHVSKIPFDQAQNKVREILKKEVLVQELKSGKKLHEIEVCQIAEKVSFDYVIKEPFFIAKKMVLNVLKTCLYLYSQPYKEIFKRSYKFFLLYEILIMLILWVGFLGFVFNAFSDPSLLSVFLKVMPFVVILLALTVVEGFARLRLPIEPLIAIFALYFWINVLKLERVV